MIVDSSAIIAILGSEAEGDTMERAIAAAPSRSQSAANYIETGIVIDGRSNATLSRGFDEFLQLMGIRIEPVSTKQARIAREAYRDYGKGRHRAGLNFGDCFAYALAKEMGEPLLFKGDDFRQTDVEVAEY